MKQGMPQSYSIPRKQISLRIELGPSAAIHSGSEQLRLVDFVPPLDGRTDGRTDGRLKGGDCHLL
jgi:hypothetical protein